MKVFIIDLESVPTRYTCEWKGHIPALLTKAAADRGRPDVEVVNISGGEAELKATPGAFLNFAATNVYKNNQLSFVAQLFSEGKVNPGDQFIFTDAWHTGVIQLKYMSELLGIPVVIHVLWHAGSYDPQDFLGRLIKDKRWTNSFEKAVFHAANYNWYATDFHINMFRKNVFGDMSYVNEQGLELHNRTELSVAGTEEKICRTGWPMEYMSGLLDPYKGLPKRDLILFPHRLAPEKQPELFRDLAASMPEYEWVICQGQELTKAQYHTLLGQAKIVFSANLQETLGISCFEGAVVDAMPLVPDMLSYTEMYDHIWKYPKEWVNSWDSYQRYGKKQLMARITDMMERPEAYWAIDPSLAKNLQENFFSANNLIDKIFNVGRP